MGLSLNPKLAHSDLGSTQLIIVNFSSLSSLEMGQPSAKASPTTFDHSGTTAEAFSDKTKPPMLIEIVADQQAEPPLVVQHSCLPGFSSESLTVGQIEAGSSADGSAMDPLTVNSVFSGGF